MKESPTGSIKRLTIICQIDNKNKQKSLYPMEYSVVEYFYTDTDNPYKEWHIHCTFSQRCVELFFLAGIKKIYNNPSSHILTANTVQRFAEIICLFCKVEYINHTITPYLERDRRNNAH